MECVIVAITANRNGIDVIAGNAFETRVSGIGYTTKKISANTQSPINRNTLAPVKTLRVSVCLTNEEERVTKKGIRKRSRTAIGAEASLTNKCKMTPSGITASTIMTLTMQKVTMQMIGRTNLIFFHPKSAFCAARNSVTTLAFSCGARSASELK
jgi:hypothetical protein